MRSKFWSAATAVLACTQMAMAFPGWMGVYGPYQRHDGGNPGVFNVLMNESGPALRAEIGVQINGGSWSVYPMGFVGLRDGNSQWQYRLPMALPDGASVKYYFHGYEEGGSNNIWDNNGGANYAFTAKPGYGGLLFGPTSAQTNGIQGQVVDGDRVYLVNTGSVCRGSVVGNEIVWSPWKKVAGDASAIGGHKGLLVAAQAGGSLLTVYRSTDEGESFQTQTMYFQGEVLKGVAVVVRGNEVIVAFGKVISNGCSAVEAHQIWMTRSTDGGVTWSPASMAIGYNPNSNCTFVETPGWEFGTTSNTFVLAYKVIYPGASHRSFNVLHSTNGTTWAPQYVDGGKYVGGFDAATSPEGAIACSAEMFDSYPNVMMLQGTNWVGVSGNLKIKQYSAGPMSVGMSDERPLFLKSSEAQSNTMEIWTMDAGSTQWALVASVGSPALGFNQYFNAPQVFDGATRTFLRWPYGHWQVSQLSCPGLEWVGNTSHWPSDSDLDPVDPLWINAESWPKGASDEALVIYSTDRKTWKAMPMTLAGEHGNNDWWHANLGSFPGGTVVEYAIAVIDCQGNYRWDSRNGQNYRATVKTAPALQWIGNTTTWPVQGSITAATDLWLNTETWPKGAGVSGKIVYTTNGTTWLTKDLNKAGVHVNNDWWNANLGKFASGTTIRFAVMVKDGNGQERWDNNGGKDYTVKVN